MTGNNLDATLDDVLSTRFYNQYHNLIKKMSMKTQFTETEISTILMVYHKLVLSNGPKARKLCTGQMFHLFMVFFKIKDISIVERIVQFITHDSKVHVDPVAWIKLFSVIMTNDLQKKMAFVFQIYNTSNDGYINRDNIAMAVSKFFDDLDEDELVEMRTDMADLLLKKFDVDRDELISFEDYKTVVTKQPLLMQFLGRCLPTKIDTTVIALCTNIMSKIDSEISL
ncbi:calaxin-like [Eurosta solidaginis]|uniref:calaxin-like n=1 Tax=Eurosta solidaginis TaxID=178769 RepID=UPI0035316969